MFCFLSSLTSNTSGPRQNIKKLSPNFKIVSAIKDVRQKSNYFFPTLSHISNSPASSLLVDKNFSTVI